MTQLEKLKRIWIDVYDSKQDTTSVIEKYFHPNYEQCINGVTLSRQTYIDHVIAQKKNMVIEHIEYTHHLENNEALFAIYYPKGKNADGSLIEAEVIGYFKFQQEQLIYIHGQVRLIKGEPVDVDM